MIKKFMCGGFPGILPCEKIIPTKQSKTVRAFSISTLIPLNKILTKRQTSTKQHNEQLNIQNKIDYEIIPNITHNSYDTIKYTKRLKSVNINKVTKLRKRLRKRK